jgi:orotate phosphoribosyltransferase
MPDGQDTGTRPSAAAYARLRDIIYRNSLLRGDSFKLSSGQTTNYFFNMKTTMLDPEGANLIADAILEQLASEQVDAIGGMALGAVPIVSVVSAKSLATGRPVPAFFVRKELKGHGTDQRIEGLLKAGTRAILVDDVTTTGASVMKAVTAARDFGCHVDTVITVVDRLEGAEENLRLEGVRLVPLYTRKDFEK